MANMNPTSEAQATTQAPPERPGIGTRVKSVAWYVPDIESAGLSPAARQLLETYSHIPPNKILKHVSETRDQAWEIFPYPCIGGFRFLSLYQGPHYAPALQRLLADPTARFLDIGCCFGQEIRRLVTDGVPGEQLLGVDLRKEFFELGYKLFQDEGRLKTNFVAADIFDESEGNGLSRLEGMFDVIYAGSFLHLFGWEQQVTVARRLIRLGKKKAGSVVYGRQTASVNPGEREKRFKDEVGGEKMWIHDEESFEQLWNVAAEKEGVKVRVKAELLRFEKTLEKAEEWRHPGSRRLDFAVFREE